MFFGIQKIFSTSEKIFFTTKKIFSIAEKTVDEAPTTLLAIGRDELE